jgi:hypothetical protein
VAGAARLRIGACRGAGVVQQSAFSPSNEPDRTRV